MTRDQRTAALLEALRLMTTSRARTDALLAQLARQTADRKLRVALETLAAAVSAGTPIERTLAELDRDIDPEALALVAVGVRSDGLEASVERAQERLESREQARRMLRGVLLRPTLIVATSALLWIVAGPLLLPEIAELTRDVWSAGDAPYCARVAVAIASRPLAIVSVAVLVIAVVLALRLAQRLPPVARVLARVWLSLPLVGELESARVGSLTVRLAASLTRASTSAPEIITHLARFVDNAHISQLHRAQVERARRGERLAELLAVGGMLPSDAGPLLRDAERHRTCRKRSTSSHRD